ncbi:energy transducer TonB [Flavobacterium sp.]|uniref:energy transducer TonB n=1 Tax=Flavobacterium sp. TaxID=239 RepID=UPI0040342C57
MEKITKEEKQSALITGIIFLSLFLPLVFFTYTVTYPDPLTVMLDGGGGGGGVTLNFGNSDDGVGANFRSELLEAASKVKAQPVTSAPAEEVVGSDSDDSEAVANTKPVEKKDPRMQNAKIETKEPVKPKQPTNSALDALLNSNNTGDGNTGRSGNQGSRNGDVSSGAYTGDGGSGGGRGGGQGSGDGTGTGPGSGSGSGGGSGAGRGTGVGDYDLGGRKPLSKPKPRYTCNEEGIVAVEIFVDGNGKVISATPGIRGTTNSAKCLLDQAKTAAMQTTWEASPTGAARQRGTIKYNFKLTD